MNLKAYILPLLKYWWLIVAAAMVATVSSYLVVRQQPPIYQTQTTLVVGRAMYEPNPSGNDLWLGQQLANYYADIGRRGEVRSATQEALGLTWLPQYSINPLPNSQLMEIVVIDSNPARAQAVANELANQLIKRSPTYQDQSSERQAFINEQITYLEGKIRETLDEITEAELQLTEMNSARQIADTQARIAALQTKLSQLQSNYAALIANTEQGAINTLSVIERAPLPTRPIGPNKMMIILLSAAVAVAIAAAAAYLLEFIDDSVKTPEEVNDLLGAVVLANIPMIVKGIDEPAPGPVSPLQALSRRLNDMFPFLQRRAAQKDGENGEDEALFVYAQKYPRSTIAEEFRALRINLDFAGVDKPIKTILVTSPSPAEGKTSVATNLAIVMAQGGKKVILLDADFRKPSINIHFKLPNKTGLSDVFRENVDLHDVAQQWKEKFLWVVTTGNAPPNPVDLLSSHRMDQIIEQIQQICDVVIIDGPPLMFPDSLALSTKVDGVLLVLRHSFTRRGAALSRYKQLTQVGARILGVVMNKTPSRRYDYYSKYKYYTEPAEDVELDPEAPQVN